MKPTDLRFKGCNFIENGKGIVVKGESVIEVEDSQFIGNDVGVEHKASRESKDPTDASEKGSHNDSNDHWYKKPVGIVTLAVIGGALVLVIRAVMSWGFPEWFH